MENGKGKREKSQVKSNRYGALFRFRTYSRISKTIPSISQFLSSNAV